MTAAAFWFNTMAATEIPRYVSLTARYVLGPWQHAEDLARYAEGLRQAGLPE